MFVCVYNYLLWAQWKKGMAKKYMRTLLKEFAVCLRRQSSPHWYKNSYKISILRSSCILVPVEDIGREGLCQQVREYLQTVLVGLYLQFSISVCWGLQNHRTLMLKQNFPKILSFQGDLRTPQLSAVQCVKWLYSFIYSSSIGVRTDSVLGPVLCDCFATLPWDTEDNSPVESQLASGNHWTNTIRRK